jgi:hypothetical protein
MKSGLFALLALWTLSAVPALCLVGVLTHACPDDAGLCCNHEDSCTSDPCAQDTRPSASQTKVPEPPHAALPISLFLGPELHLDGTSLLFHSLMSRSLNALVSRQVHPLLI